MSRLAAFADFCTSTPCKSPLLNPNVSPICLLSPPMAGQLRLAIEGASSAAKAKGPSITAMPELSEDNLSLNPSAVEFCPTTCATDEPVSAEQLDGITDVPVLNVTAPVFVPRMPTSQEATRNDGDCGSKSNLDVLSSSTQQLTTFMPVSAVQPIRIAPPSTLILLPQTVSAAQGIQLERIQLPPTTAAITLSEKDVSLSSMIPLPPPPGTAVLRTHLQRMSRELEAAKRKDVLVTKKEVSKSDLLSPPARKVVPLNL